MSQSGSESHLHLRAAFVGRDVHALLYNVLGRTRRSSAAPSRDESNSEVVASYSTRHDTLTLSSLLYGRLPVEFQLKPNSRSYESFLRLLLEELKRISAEEKQQGRADQRNSVIRLTEHLEKKIRAFAGTGHSAPGIPKATGFSPQKGKLPGQSPSQRPASSSGAFVTRPTPFGGLAQVIDVFRDDVEQTKREPRGNTRERPLLSRQGLSERRFHFVRSQQETPQFISGFLNLEVDQDAPDADERVGAEAAGRIDVTAATEILKRAFRVTAGRLVEVQGTRATVEFDCEVPSSLSEHVEFLLHWGRFSGAAYGWWDEEILAKNVQRIAMGRSGRRWRSRRRVGGTVVEVESFRVRKEVDVEFDARDGSFGAVLSARIRGEVDRCWGKIPGVGDLCFQIADMQERTPLGATLGTDTGEMKLHQSLSTFDRFTEYTASRPALRTQPLPSRLAEALRWNPALGASLSEYGRTAEQLLRTDRSSGKRKAYATVARSIRNIGLGNIAIVAPEGPHAIAGGLAQVVVGLTSVFEEQGIETTIITPLYEEAQGSKHRSAKEILQDGIILAGKRCQLEFRGVVRVPFGPEFASGTSHIVRNAHLALVEVYESRVGTVRAMFLRHRTLADRLYSAADSGEQIRRAIFLSRGALELLRDDQFGVHADAVITNDWLTGLLPVYLNTHSRYQSVSCLKHLPVIHMLHNCGQAYQGRFYTNQYGHDLWPVFDLASDHFFGMTDPNDRRFLNLTAAAVNHTSGALLAVSKPYADALLTEKGAEGLQGLFREKREILFGISNGIDLGELRKFTWRVGEQASQLLGKKAPVLARYRSDAMISRLAEYKTSAKQLVQRSRGLTEDPNATLISLVGRLAEQKGIGLLASPGEDGRPLIESILEEFPCAQFLFAGPLTANDPAAKLFMKVVEDLVERYPGRIQRAFTFLPHREALEITLGSNLFLMPSRYEPGGITQLEALACGTPVVARRVGGLAATITEYNPLERSGNGFFFETYTPQALGQALRTAIVLAGDPRHRAALLRAGALAENDWSNRAESYVSLLQHVVGTLGATVELPEFSARRKLVATARAGS